MSWFENTDINAVPHSPFRAWGIACLVTVVVVIGGCGYRFAGSGPLPGNVQSVAVVVPENRSAESGLEITLASELVRVFSQRGGLRVTDAAAAEARVLTVIRSVPVDAIVRSSANQTTQQRVSIIVDMRLVDHAAQTLWHREQISDSEAFVVGSSRAATDQARRAALRVVISRLADKLYRAMTDNF